MRYNDPVCNRIKLHGQHMGFIIESNDVDAFGCMGLAIERHLDAIPPH